VPLAKLYIKGHMIWQGDHPIAAGAKKVNFIADEDYEVTPLLQGFADAINQVAGKAYAIWEVNRTQSIFKRHLHRSGLRRGKFSRSSIWSISETICCSGGRDMSMAVVSTKKKTGRPTCRYRSSESGHEFQSAIQESFCPQPSKAAARPSLFPAALANPRPAHRPPILANSRPAALDP
jgi:hypothetical protein